MSAPGPPEPITYIGRVAMFVRSHEPHEPVRIFVVCGPCGVSLLDSPVGPGAVTTLRTILFEIERLIVEHEEGRDRC